MTSVLHLRVMYQYFMPEKISTILNEIHSERYGYLEGRESLRGQNITAALMSDVGFKEEVQRAILDFQVSFNMAVTLT